MKHYINTCLVLSLAVSVYATADDTEIFTGGGAAGNQNILMIMDTSRSMSAWADTSVEPYSSSVTYESYGFERDSLYLIQNDSSLDSLTDAQVDQVKSNEITEESINCSTVNSIISSLANTGRSVASYAFYQPGEGWETNTVSTEPGTITQCNEVSRYNYQGGSFKYLANTTKFELDGSIYTNQRGEYSCFWFICRFDNYDYTWNNNVYSQIVTGNYLNYRGWDGKEPEQLMRIDAVKRAANEVVGSLSAPNINVGLMRFNSDHSPSRSNGQSDTETGHGGYLALPLTSVSELGNQFEEKLDSFDAIGGTPLQQTLYEAYAYFSGGKVTYGDPAYYAEWDKPIDDSWRDNSDTDNPGMIDMLETWRGDFYSNVDFFTTESAATNNGNYIKPDFQGCQPSNKIVFFSDGDASGFDDAKTNIEAIDSSISCSGSECLNALANYMSKVSELDITVNTIGGFVSANDDATETLEELASAGEGTFYPADDYQELVDAFSDAITGDLLEEPSTFTSPAIAVSSYNSLKASNDLYYAVFEPKSDGTWRGNLKRYQISTRGILDSKNNLAINPDTGFFNVNATSLWSDTQDGADVALGGVVERFGDVSNRSIYGLINGSLTPLTEGKLAALSDELLGVDILGGDDLLDLPDLGLGVKSRLSKWILGKNADDSARLSMEDPIHSRPIVFNYEGGKRLVFIGTNGGYLHAFDADTGVEEYAIIPQEVLKNPLYYLDPEKFRSPDKIYGLDGPVSFFHNDKDRDTRIDSGEEAYLYVGMRRGGHTYYAFDISKSSSPTLLWQKNGTYVDQPKKNIPNLSQGFERLGQTWSALKPALVKNKGIVLIAGGGYDPDEDGSTSTGPVERLKHDTGNTIYMLDPTTGDVVWDAYKDLPELAGAMTSSFASDISPVDTNNDGFIDIFFAADVGGRIWRFDIFDGGITGDIIADLSTGTGNGNRRFYNSPDVSMQNEKLLISIGSGYRAHPLTTNVNDHFYLLIDNNGVNKAQDQPYGKIALSDLREWSSASVTTVDQMGSDVSNVTKGWYVDLTLSGEKVINSSITFQGVVMFNTFAPTSDAELSACTGNLGVTRSYLLAVTDYAEKVCGEDCEEPTTTNTTIGPPTLIGPFSKCDVDGACDDPTTVEPDKLPSSCEDSEVIVIAGTSTRSAPANACELFERNYWKEQL